MTTMDATLSACGLEDRIEGFLSGRALGSAQRRERPAFDELAKNRTKKLERNENLC